MERSIIFGGLWKRIYGRIYGREGKGKEKEDFLLPKEKNETNFGQRQKNIGPR